VKLSPRSANAQANVGAEYSKLNRAEEAVLALHRAALLDPQNAETQSSLGTALTQVHQSKQAALAFGKAVQKKPEDMDLRYNWAVALLDSGETAKAKEVLLALPNKD
jgi:Flp pilus assembly protein TadD